jgi:hypothetical protein
MSEFTAHAVKVKIDSFAKEIDKPTNKSRQDLYMCVLFSIGVFFSIIIDVKKNVIFMVYMSSRKIIEAFFRRRDTTCDFNNVFFGIFVIVSTVDIPQTLG